MENHITNKCGFFAFGCEVINHIKRLERERTDDVPFSFCMGKKQNDREIFSVI